MKRWIILILCGLMMMHAGCATADMKRGSRGEEVQYVQEMLIEMGFLNDQADGVFGRKTQAAVKALQKYLGLRQTGVLKDPDLVALYHLNSIATGMLSEDGRGEDEIRDLYPSNCSWEAKNEWGAVFCYRHQEEYLAAMQLEKPNAPEKLKSLLENRICELWEQAILDMYDAWVEMQEDDAAQQAILDRQIAYEETLDSIESVSEKRVWLEKEGIDLCLEVYGSGDDEEQETP